MPKQLQQQQHTLEIPLPNAFKASYTQHGFIRALCHAYLPLGTKLGRELLKPERCAGGRGRARREGQGAAEKQEWKEAVWMLKVLEATWEANG